MSISYVVDRQECLSYCETNAWRGAGLAGNRAGRHAGRVGLAGTHAGHQTARVDRIGSHVGPRAAPAAKPLRVDPVDTHAGRILIRAGLAGSRDRPCGALSGRHEFLGDLLAAPGIPPVQSGSDLSLAPTRSPKDPSAK